MSDEEDVQALARAMGEVHEPIILHMDRASAATLIAGLQLACRHPGNVGPSRRHMEAIARTIQDVMAKDSPEVGRLLERGWHQVFDHHREGEGR